MRGVDFSEKNVKREGILKGGVDFSKKITNKG